jgi:hypothetical protein
MNAYIYKQYMSHLNFAYLLNHLKITGTLILRYFYIIIKKEKLTFYSYSQMMLSKDTRLLK